jgi:hypothetical protein
VQLSSILLMEVVSSAMLFKSTYSEVIANLRQQMIFFSKKYGEHVNVIKYSD